MGAKGVNVITIRATLEWFTPVWRDIEARDNQTLVMLHEEIQHAFQWYNDHLYAFFMSGREWDNDKSMRYSEPITLREEGTDDPNERSANIRLRDLSLRAGQRIAYVYDYGDNLSLMLDILKISETEPNVKYPRVIALRGFSPEQYHYHTGYSEEIKRELKKGLPKIVKVESEREEDILKQWSESSAKY